MFYINDLKINEIQILTRLPESGKNPMRDYEHSLSQIISSNYEMDRVFEIQESMKEDGFKREFPVIILLMEHGRYFGEQEDWRVGIVNGRHRFLAAQGLGLDKIPAIVLMREDWSLIHPDVDWEELQAILYKPEILAIIQADDWEDVDIEDVLGSSILSLSTSLI